jgi:hypothetical protein
VFRRHPLMGSFHQVRDVMESWGHKVVLRDEHQRVVKEDEGGF